MADAPNIAGQRRPGEQAEDARPEPAPSPVDTDPRTAEITVAFRRPVIVTFNRGAHAATYEFAAEPSDAELADARSAAEDTMDRLEAQRTQELQDRRKARE